MPVMQKEDATGPNENTQNQDAGADLFDTDELTAHCQCAYVMCFISLPLIWGGMPCDAAWLWG